MTTPLESQTTKELVDIYRAKAPVCLCPPPHRPCQLYKGDWCGPQRQASQAFAILAKRNIKIPRDILFALAHAENDEDREEFDLLVDVWSLKFKDTP